jgi:hypothetical protein
MGAKVGFTGELILERAPDHTGNGRAEWIGVGELVFHDSDGNTITFGKGAKTDLGSVPQLAWSFGFPPDGEGVDAYVIHDLLYKTQGLCLWSGEKWRTRSKPYSRSEADDILRRALIACGVSSWRARIVWAAVRLGGATSWGD